MIAALWLILGLAWGGPSAQQALEAGMEAQRDGRTQEAKAHYTQCLELEPDKAACHWELGWSHWSAGAWSAVVERWERVAELEPEHPELSRWLGMAREHKGHLATLREAAASAPASVRSPLPEGQSLRVLGVGDIMLGTDYPHPTDYLPPNDGEGMLDAVTPLLGGQGADLVFGNLEGPLCDGKGTSKCTPGRSNCFAFRTPTRYARYLDQAGFDLVSVANNHAMDFGPECRQETIETVEALGMAWSGPPGTIASVERNDAQVAMVAFHTARHSNYLNDHAAAAELVELADASHDYVIVSFHGGAEGGDATRVPHQAETYFGENRGHLRAFSRAVVEAGADLVLGHGPHVPRGFELIDGKLVAYSLGNFATYGRFSLRGHASTSLVLDVVLDHQGDLVQGQIHPVRLVNRGIPEPDPEAVAIDLIRELSRRDFPDTHPVIAQDGTFAPSDPAADVADE